MEDVSPINERMKGVGGIVGRMEEVGRIGRKIDHTDEGVGCGTMKEGVR